MSAQVIAVADIAGAGRRSTGVAAEARHGTSGGRGVDVVVARARRQGELLRNDVEIRRAEDRFLDVTAGDVIEKRLIVGAYIRVSHVGAGRRSDIGQATNLPRRRARRQG